MIRFKVKKDGKCYLGFCCKGHAGYAAYGSDIVCAAVSMLVINTVNAIERFTDCQMQVSDDEKSGSVTVDFPQGTDEQAALLMDALLLGIKSVEEQYGSSHVRLEE
ncbi:MAG: ribosomal-processing cysteine protease Prp [Lachnospiraceae bacterium]|nr:ribosomal-processing cysteine protease Prp [Lachnospiraceae bacterium]